MNIVALVVLLGLMGTACSSHHCKSPSTHHRIKYYQADFKHVSELQHSSVAPWNISTDSNANREPQIIEYAHCNGCTVENMIAKPIIFQVSVYERIHNGTGYTWCKRPFDLAVGCTCVSKQ